MNLLLPARSQRRWLGTIRTQDRQLRGLMQYQQPFTGPAGQGALPTTATTQSYTQDQIAIALTGLIDQGKRDYVMQILGQFGAMSLMQVPVERYPELVTQLRGAGANI